ncbi:hypothetical protein [Roseibium sediminicola]|uniref:MotA/TolQ/ExbB proton channel family protein n=1 Tax=Roseibium sediminicola TaxID=2933272 RepID=A0ABT0GRZ1_9HYPH|nr:hypothetical protein [Roseibium sp. CAU 1639]MCK7612000.1 hypothetical protein [Roseibium sp. CAU 1639]
MYLDISKDYHLKKYWQICSLIIGLALLVVIISLHSNAPSSTDTDSVSALEPLLFVVDPVQAAISTLGVLFIIALFVERANEVFVSSTRLLVRKQAELEIAAIEAEPLDDASKANLAQAKKTLLAYRTGTRLVTMTFSVIVSTLLALAGTRALSPLLEVQFDALAQVQWAALQFVDILLTVAIISGGSSGIHTLLSTITDQFPNKQNSIDAQTTPG